MKRLFFVLVAIFSLNVSAVTLESKLGVCEASAQIAFYIANNRDRGIPKEYAKEALLDDLRGEVRYRVMTDQLDVRPLIPMIYQIPDKLPFVIQDIMMKSCFKGNQ